MHGNSVLIVKYILNKYSLSWAADLTNVVSNTIAGTIRITYNQEQVTFLLMDFHLNIDNIFEGMYLR